jgi:hypothetical protein
MPTFRLLIIGLALLANAAVNPAGADTAWTSPHLTIEKFATWSEFLDVLNRPHIDMFIRNDGSEAIGSYGFRCRLHLLDRATPIFESSWATDLDRVIRPGEARTVKLSPNMFSEAAQVIQHRYDNAAWSCYVDRVLTASGRSIGFEPGQLPTEGPPFGVGYAPLPDAMAPLLKVPAGAGMWVMKVQPGSAAEASGLTSGDVILAIDGHPLKVVSDLRDALLAARTAGHAPHLSVVRKGQPLDIEAKPSQAPVLGQASEALAANRAGQ